MVKTTLTSSKQTQSLQTNNSTPRVTTSISFLSDHDLLMLCTHYGIQAKLWKQRFLGLLPEVERRRLYLKEGCTSLFEFAAKLGGVSKEQVKVVLSLHNRFEATPLLKHALVSGEVSVNKLARVVSVATPENQEFWAQQSQQLSQAGLETLVRDTKNLRTQTQKPNKTEKVEQFDDLGLSPEIRNRLLSLRNKGIDLNQVLGELLNQHEQNIKQEKQKIAEELIEKEGNKSRSMISRHIPQKVKAVLKQEYGEKCAHETCINKATNIHHTRRYGLDLSHNPLFLAPLCAQHHEIAHAVDVKVAERRSSMRMM